MQVIFEFSMREELIADVGQFGLYSPASSDDVLQQLDGRAMWSTVLKMPLDENADDSADLPHLYDPRFVLRSALEVFELASGVDPLPLVERNVLALAFAATASHCAEMRAVALALLHRCAVRMREMVAWKQHHWLIRTFRDGLKEPGQRVTSGGW